MGRKGIKRKLDPAESEQQPVRRSARLAALYRARPSPPPVDADHPPSPSQSAIEFQSRVEVDPLAWLPEMRFAIAPPDIVVAGVALKLPVLVTFEVSDTAKGSDGEEAASIDFSGCWAFLSLVAEDRKSVLAPPRQDLLKGTITDSIHELDSPQEGSTQVVGYAAFKDLKILETGRYCFGVNVVDMNNSLSPGSEAKISKVLHSATFQVVDHGQTHGSPAPQALARLREIGVEI